MNKGIVLTLSMLLSVSQVYGSDCGGNGLLGRLKATCTKPIIAAAGIGYAAGYYYNKGKNAASTDTSKMPDEALAAALVNKLQQPVIVTAPNGVADTSPIKRSKSFDSLASALQNRGVWSVGYMDAANKPKVSYNSLVTAQSAKSVAVFTINGLITAQQVDAAHAVLYNLEAANSVIKSRDAAAKTNN